MRRRRALQHRRAPERPARVLQAHAARVLHYPLPAQSLVLSRLPCEEALERLRARRERAGERWGGGARACTAASHARARSVCEGMRRGGGACACAGRARKRLVSGLLAARAARDGARARVRARPHASWMYADARRCAARAVRAGGGGTSYADEVASQVTSAAATKAGSDEPAAALATPSEMRPAPDLEAAAAEGGNVHGGAICGRSERMRHGANGERKVPSVVVPQPFITATARHVSLIFNATSQVRKQPSFVFP